MVFVYGLPLLLLIIPASFQASYYIIGYLFVAGIIFQQYKGKKIGGFDKKALVFSIAVNAIFVLLFIDKWYPSSALQSIADIIHLSKGFILITVGLLFGVLSVLGLYKLFRYFIDYIVNIKNSNIVLWFENKKISKKETYIISFVLATVLLISQSRLPIYTDIDNYGISMVLNGSYSSDNFCCFVSPILSFIVKMIDSILPNADGFVVFMEFCMFASAWLLFSVLFSICKRKLSVIIIFSLLMTINLYNNLFHCNFTIFAGILCLIGAFGIYAFLIKKIGKLLCAVSICLYFAGGLFRYTVTLLTLPFVLLAIGFYLINGRKQIKEIIKRSLLIVLAIFACIATNSVISNTFTSSDKYIESVRYNNARSQLFDYPQKDYSEIQSELNSINVSSNDYKSIKASLLADTSIVSADYLMNISKVSNDSFDGNDNIISRFSNVWYTLQTNIAVIIVCVFLLCSLSFLFLFTKCRVIYLLEIVFSILGAILIFCFFAINGRIPDRVLLVILLGAVFVVITVLINGNIELEMKANRLSLVLLGLALGLSFASYFNVNKLTNGHLFDSMNAKTVQSDTMQDNNIYVWGKDDYNKFVEKVYWQNNKLPSDVFMKNNIHDGKWVYGQVCFINYLNNIGVKNPMKSLLEDNVYYVANKSRCDISLLFLREHYSSRIKVKQTGENHNIPVWKFLA